jgi:hypothetical protein
MRAFGAEYSSDSAYFIVKKRRLFGRRGRTLELIKKLEDEYKNREAILAEVAREYGANELTAIGVFIFKSDHDIADPALKFEPDFSSDPQKDFFYTINEKTSEGRALQERLDDLPAYAIDNRVFARRLTGAEYVVVNPDKLQEPGTYETRFGGRENAQAAHYRKYGNVYFVEVPITLRGIFNEVSEKESIRGAKRFAGYIYEWFTPPDSRQIPYSKVIKLREKELGDQKKPRQVNVKLGSLTRYP